jgi:hypothetical protein
MIMVSDLSHAESFFKRRNEVGDSNNDKPLTAIIF